MIAPGPGPPRFLVEAVGGVIFVPYSNVDNFRPEVHMDVISGVSVDSTGMKARVKFGDSRSKCSRILPHFVTNDNDDDDDIIALNSDLESPALTTSVPTYSTVTPDMDALLPGGSYRRKNRRKCHLRRLRL